MKGSRTTPPGSLSHGEQVKIVAPSHPWVGAIGLLAEENFAGNTGYWVVELETILPGQRAMAHESELRRV